MKTSFGDRAFYALAGAFLLLLALACICPLYYVLVISISDPELVSKGAVTLIPRGIRLDNYLKIFRLPSIANAALVSVARTVAGSAITLLATSFLAFLLAQRKMRFRKASYRFVVVTMYFNAGLVPWFLTMRGLGLADSFLLYILPTAVPAFYLVLLKTYIEQIDPALQESALIDGAGYGSIYLKIIVPVSQPILATIAVFASVAQWNSFYDNLFLVHRSDLQTLQLMLYQYLNEVESIANVMRGSSMSAGGPAAIVMSPVGVRMTITMIVVAPILVVYPLMQRYFVKGIMLGAVKG